MASIWASLVAYKYRKGNHSKYTWNILKCTVIHVLSLSYFCCFFAVYLYSRIHQLSSLSSSETFCRFHFSFMVHGFPASWYIMRATDGSSYYNDVIMSAMASQITSLTSVNSSVYSGTDQIKHQTPRHWPLCGEFTGDLWIPHRNGQ